MDRPSGAGCPAAAAAPLSAEQKRALLAELLRRKAAGKSPNGSPPPAVTPLSYGQRALWFLHRLDPESAAYNLHFCARVRPALDPDALRKTLRALMARHAGLRSTFLDRGDGPVQLVYDAVTPALDVYDAAAWPEDELDRRLHAEAHRP